MDMASVYVDNGAVIKKIAETANEKGFLIGSLR